MADTSSPIAGPVAHVYVDRDGGGICLCGFARFTGVHVAYDGTPEAGLGGIGEQLDTIDNAVAAIRSIVGGARP